MTIDEAIQNREDCLKYLEGIGKKASPCCVEAMRWSVKALKAFRPVSREQVEKVFPGCPACKNGPPKLHIPAFRAMAVCNQHMDHEAFDIELNSKFCLNCGRPLTDKAVDMLMERLEALHGDR